MKIKTLIQAPEALDQEVYWEGDDYCDEPHGEAVVQLLKPNPHMQVVEKVVVYTGHGDVLTFTVVDETSTEKV